MSKGGSDGEGDRSPYWYGKLPYGWRDVRFPVCVRHFTSKFGSAKVLHFISHTSSVRQMKVIFLLSKGGRGVAGVELGNFKSWADK